MIEEEKGFEYKDLGLKSLLEAISGSLPKTKVGILGDKTKRKAGEKSNADVGLKHEFGKEGMPERSFLRMPLIEYLQKELDDSKLFTEEALHKVIDTGKITEWIRIVGVMAELVISDAFASGGFGKWKPSNMKYKKVQQTLVETTQLRDSITSEIVE